MSRQEYGPLAGMSSPQPIGLDGAGERLRYDVPPLVWPEAPNVGANKEPLCSPDIVRDVDDRNGRFADLLRAIGSKVASHGASFQPFETGSVRVLLFPSQSIDSSAIATKNPHLTQAELDEQLATAHTDMPSPRQLRLYGLEVVRNVLWVGFVPGDKTRSEPTQHDPLLPERDAVSSRVAQLGGAVSGTEYAAPRFGIGTLRGKIKQAPGWIPGVGRRLLTKPVFAELSHATATPPRRS